MPAVKTRAERTLETRRRMVEAAYRRFCADGYGGTTMHAIAEEAGVAVQTLYYTFHTKAALLGEAIGAGVVGFEAWAPPPSGDLGVADLKPITPWWSGFEAAPDSAAALAHFATTGVLILERLAPLIAAMHGGAGDADAEAVVSLAEERRLAMYREVARVLSRKPGGLRAGLTVAEATDLLVVLFSPELYQGLVSRGWSRPRRAAFFQQLLASQILGRDG